MLPVQINIMCNPWRSKAQRMGEMQTLELFWWDFDASDLSNCQLRDLKMVVKVAFQSNRLALVKHAAPRGNAALS